MIIEETLNNYQYKWSWFVYFCNIQINSSLLSLNVENNETREGKQISDERVEI